MSTETPKTPKTKVMLIPAAVRPFKKVAIYCRVSTTHESQEESLGIQIKTLKQIVANNPKWKLYEIFSNISDSIIGLCAYFIKNWFKLK